MNRLRNLHLRPFTIAAAAAAIVALGYLLVWVALGAPDGVAARDQSHLLLDAAIAVAALLACLVALARMSRVVRVEDLLLASGLAVMATGALAWRVVAPPDDPGLFGTATATRLLGAVLVLGAALVPHDRVVTHLRGPLWRSAAVFVVAIGGLCVVSLTLDSLAMNAAIARPGVVLAATLGLAGAIAMLRKERLTGDPLWGWLAIALTLLAISRIQVAISSLGHPGAFGGDLLPLAAYFCVLLGAVSEVRTYWAARAREEAAIEARSLAMQIHDGLVQDVVYARRIAADTVIDPQARERIAGALIRAEKEARSLMEAVEKSRPLDFAQALELEVQSAGERMGIIVTTTIARDLRPRPEVAEMLIRAAVEGVHNAARHSGARTVLVEAFERNGKILLRVRDRGRGTASEEYGYGLTTVREDAARSGGSLRTASSPGRGMSILVEVEP